MPFPTKKSLLAFLLVGSILALTLTYSTALAMPATIQSGNSLVYLPIVVKPNSQPAWLSYLNSYRAIAGLPALTEDPTYSAGDYNHAVYTVKTGVLAHEENPSSPWYTPSGDLAAHNGNVMAGSSTSYTDEDAIDLWMQGPFHALGILDPHLQITGFGSYRAASGATQMAAALDVLRGRGNLPSSVVFPIRWPGDGATVPLSRYSGGETPNPLAKCGYTAPTGLPVILEIGDGSQTPAVDVGQSSFKQGATALAFCIYDETSFADGTTEHAVLDSRDAIVLIPQQPLTPGSTYTPTITTNDVTYTWSFTVSGSAQGAQTSGSGTFQRGQ